MVPTDARFTAQAHGGDSSKNPRGHQARAACLVGAGEELLLTCVVCDWVAFEDLW